MQTQNELLFAHSVKIFEFLRPIHLVHHLVPPKPHQNWFNLRRRKILKFPHCLEELKKSLVFHHNSCFLLLHHVCCIIFPRKKGLINGTMFTTIDVTIKYSILHYFQVLRPTHLSKAPLRSWKPPNCLFPLLHNKLISILLLPLFRSFCLIKASFLLHSFDLFEKVPLSKVYELGPKSHCITANEDVLNARLSRGDLIRGRNFLAPFRAIRSPPKFSTGYPALPSK